MLVTLTFCNKGGKYVIDFLSMDGKKVMIVCRQLWLATKVAGTIHDINQQCHVHRLRTHELNK